jgi:hypothetical protein
MALPSVLAPEMRSTCSDTGLASDSMSLVSGASAEVPGGVVADEVHDRRVGPPGVVQVGDAVGEPRARGAAA